MKIISNYKTYVVLSLVSLGIDAFLSMLRITSNVEAIAMFAFIFFTVAVGIVAIDELLIVRPLLWKK